MDWACANIEWRDLFPYSKEHHLQTTYSDHDPILLTIEGNPRDARQRKKPNRFEEQWASHPACANIIHEVWNGWNPTGSPMYKLFETIKKCRGALVEWSRTLANSKTKIDEKYKELEVLNSMDRAENWVVIQKVRSDINSLLFQEELFWRQRPRSIWLPTRDKHTKYFYKKASQRRRKNHIHGFLNENGQWVTSKYDIARVAESYFQNLFKTPQLTNIDL